MQIPRSYLENYSKALNVVSERARALLVDALSQIDYSADVATIREAVIAIMQPACGASSTLAARLAAEFYDGLRVRFGIDDGFRAEVDSRREPEATSGAVRAFADKLDDSIPNVSAFQQLCVDRIDYETRRAANECITYNAKNDPKKPRWARIPTGAETCQFCIMLASRGFVYHSEETASHAHAHCDCRVVPSWDKSPLAQGYDPDKYYDMWKHPEKYENAKDEGVEPDDKPSDKSERESRFNDYLTAREKRSEIYNRLRQEKDSERKQQIRAELSKADEAIKSARDKLTNGEFMLLSARIYPAGEYITPSKWNKTPSTDEIVQLMGGGDRTTGSCSSLAFAYFANKGGEVVRDFRGGSSCNFFSQNGHIKDIAKIDGVESFVEEHKNAFTAAGRVVQNIQEGKRYYFCVGKHAAVVEKRDDSIYYLELQSQTDNGWHKLTNTSLKQRFGCTKSSSISGIKIDQDALLIDGDTLSNNAEFLELMGYINTPEGKQKKGVGGGVK